MVTWGLFVMLVSTLWFDCFLQYARENTKLISVVCFLVGLMLLVVGVIQWIMGRMT